MIELAISIIIVAGIAGFLTNKYLEILRQEYDRKYSINMLSAEADIQNAVDKALKSYDDRINNTWGTISHVKQEVEALKLSVGLRRVSNG